MIPCDPPRRDSRSCRGYPTPQTPNIDRLAARGLLGQSPCDCRAVMLRGERWKYVHYEGFRPQLFDLRDEPLEPVDRGTDLTCRALRDPPFPAAPGQPIRPRRPIAA